MQSYAKFSRRVTALLLAAAVLCAVLPTASASDSGVTALFDSYQPENGNFTLPENARIYVVSQDSLSGMLLSTLQLAAARMEAQGLLRGAETRIVCGAADGVRAGDIVVRRDASLADEAYRIVVREDNVTLYYTDGDACRFYGGEGSHNSLLYAFTALIRLFDGDSAACCTLADAPDTAERTVQLDIGRKYWTTDWIKNLIDELSWMGYNALELHLTEDQGCRADIWHDAGGASVPDCNGNDFGWMIGYHAVSWNSDNTDPAADRFYNRDELTELVEYARARHLEIIPAVDYPTHADCLIAKFRENFVESGTDFTFRFDGVTYSGHDSLQAGNNATIDVTNDYARNLTFAVTEAYAAFFGALGCAKYNIGGDEVSGASAAWATSAFNLANGGSADNCKDAYVIYMNMLCDILTRDEYDYSVRAWNDCLFGTGFYYYADGRQRQFTASATVAPNAEIAVCFWTASTSHTSPTALAAQGRTVYNCVNWYTYYVLRNNGTYGDARDDDCLQWTFNHASPARIYGGCGGDCAYDCRHTGGWNPTDFNGCTADCFTDQFVTGDALGGGYFLIWGDWAGWDSEENIWNRTDSYGLIDRLWANAAKQWDHDADSSLGYDDFRAAVAQFRFFPGYVGCTDAPAFGGGTTVLVKVACGAETRLTEVVRVRAEADASYRLALRAPDVCAYTRADAARFLPALTDPSRGTLVLKGEGLLATADGIVTVWFENRPNLDGLRLLLTRPNAEALAATPEAYAAALRFYQKIAPAPNRLTTQSEITPHLQALLGR